MSRPKEIQFCFCESRLLAGHSNTVPVPHRCLSYVAATSNFGHSFYFEQQNIRPFSIKKNKSKICNFENVFVQIASIAKPVSRDPTPSTTIHWPINAPTKKQNSPINIPYHFNEPVATLSCPNSTGRPQIPGRCPPNFRPPAPACSTTTSVFAVALPIIRFVVRTLEAYKTPHPRISPGLSIHISAIPSIPGLLTVANYI